MEEFISHWALARQADKIHSVCAQRWWESWGQGSVSSCCVCWNRNLRHLLQRCWVLNQESGSQASTWLPCSRSLTGCLHSVSLNSFPWEKWVLMPFHTVSQGVPWTPVIRSQACEDVMLSGELCRFKCLWFFLLFGFHAAYSWPGPGWRVCVKGKHTDTHRHTGENVSREALTGLLWFGVGLEGIKDKSHFNRCSWTKGGRKGGNPPGCWPRIRRPEFQARCVPDLWLSSVGPRPLQEQEGTGSWP